MHHIFCLQQYYATFTVSILGEISFRIYVICINYLQQWGSCDVVGWSACLHVVAKMFHSHFINFCCLCSPILTILSPLESEMISAHMWNKIFHLALTLLLHLIKNCAVNIDNPSTFFLQKYRAFQQISHTKQVKDGHSK